MDSSADDANKLSHATRRAFCTDLLLTSTALVLAAPTVTKVMAAQDSMVAYPPRKIEGKSDEQDFYVFSANETAQIVYSAQKVVTISADYAGGVGAPDYKSVVGEGLLERPDGSLFRMVLYDSERFWVSYNKSASVEPVVTITIGTLK